MDFNASENRRKGIQVLTLNTLAFGVCFACWMLNGVLVAYLVDANLFAWDEGQMGLLIASPVLIGSLGRLPIGMLTDRFGGRPVYTAILLVSAVPMYLLGRADSFATFLLCSFGIGIAGTSFASGIAYTSVWFKKEQQGTALGLFGMGNIGAAATAFGAPLLLRALTQHGEHPENWRILPQIYAGALVAMAALFYLLTFPRASSKAAPTPWARRLAPLVTLRVWRFGLYYFFVFGGFVALSQWLVLYYLNVYSMTLALAGLMTAAFSMPAALTRALGGWLSDRYGARRVMYTVFGVAALCCGLLIVPRMDVYSPGGGILATRAGAVTRVEDEVIVVGDKEYRFKPRPGLTQSAIRSQVNETKTMIWPTFKSWHEPSVHVGDSVAKRQVIAKGITHIYFQANVWVFSAIILALGVTLGIGMAGVYKYIADYFPAEMGAVGGLVGVIGGLGGFFGPLLFGYLLKATGIWITCWMLLLAAALGCLVWLHTVVQRMMMRQVPALMATMEANEGDAGR
ncbi:MAG: NarK/NasA family nitrate transporter [Verrucomicrobiae bacterium]|nr:NarK/NasA family nitrate transporter [Verrucomicrobiae bacterium]